MSYKVGDLVLKDGKLGIIDSVVDLIHAILVDVCFADGTKGTFYDQELTRWYW